MPDSGSSLACPLCATRQTLFFFDDPKNYQHRYHHCPVCDLVFVTPECRLDSAAEKARYDMHHNDDSPSYIAFLSRLANPLLARLPATAHGLDFGSGKSPAMANLFRQAGHRCDCYDPYFQANHQLLKRRYDFLLASEVIEHLYHPKQTFQQWLSMLKPKGLLAIMTGFRPDDSEFPDWWYKNDPTHVGLFSQKTFIFLQAQYQLDLVFLQKNIIIFRLPE